MPQRYSVFSVFSVVSMVAHVVSIVQHGTRRKPHSDAMLPSMHPGYSCNCIARKHAVSISFWKYTNLVVQQRVFWGTA